jgi:hypothetical protein
MARIKARGVSADPFADGFWLTVDTTQAGSANDTFVLPTPGSGSYDYYVDWGEGGVIEHIVSNASQTHVYAAPGIYTIKIRGTFPRVYFNDAGDCLKLTALQIGDVGWLSMNFAFAGCINLVSITGPHNTSNVTEFTSAWAGCISLLNFPLIDVSAATALIYTWANCFALASFPLIDTSSITNFSHTWENCYALTGFPLIDTSTALSLEAAWYGCGAITSFPLINTSSVTIFNTTWSNTGLESFPLLDVSNGVDFNGAWELCTGLNGYDFPTLNMRKMQGGGLCFSGVALSTESYSNLLIDIALGAETGVTFDGGDSLYNSIGATARDTLVNSRGWDITDGGPEPA